MKIRFFDPKSKSNPERKTWPVEHVELRSDTSNGVEQVRFIVVAGGVLPKRQRRGPPRLAAHSILEASGVLWWPGSGEGREVQPGSRAGEGN